MIINLYIWPFQASIVVELVNWRKDTNHHSNTLHFNEHTPMKCKFRVTEGEQVLKGQGTGTCIFISYSSLCYNSNTNTEYLQDDCLRIRVKQFIVYSTPHTLCVKKPSWQGPETKFLHNYTFQGKNTS